ncbi:MAG: hypothetical protein ACYDH3_08525 [Candidatus Aminicenantales bacterium]
MKARAFIFVSGLIAAGFGPLAAQSPRNYLTLLGGIHHHLQSGSVDDYVLGENDFPVVPAHNGVLIGFSYMRTLGKMFGAEIDARFIGSAGVVLADPSDGDTIDVKSGPHAPLTLSALFLPLAGKIRPYLLAGGGVDVFLAGAASYTSRYGYQIDMPAPAFKERFDAEVHAGGGVFVAIGKRWGIRLDSRYVWIFDKPDTLGGFSLAAGFFLSF